MMHLAKFVLAALFVAGAIAAPADVPAAAVASVADGKPSDVQHPHPHPSHAKKPQPRPSKKPEPPHPHPSKKPEPPHPHPSKKPHNPHTKPGHPQDEAAAPTEAPEA